MSDRNILDALDINIQDLERTEKSYPSTSKSKQKTQSVSSTLSHKQPVSNHNYEYTILEKYGSLSRGAFAPEFSKVDWGGSVKYDLRRWKKDGTPGKGFTFTIEELKKIKTTISQNGKVGIHSNSVIKTYVGESSTAKIYSIIVELSSYSLKGQDWVKQVSVIDWGYGKKIDFHAWTTDYKKCSKGMCLSFDEFDAFLALINAVVK